MKVLSLVTDAYGGRGGIAQFNRDLLATLSGAAGIEVTAVPRLVQDAPGPMPDGLRFVTEASRGKVRYVREVLRLVRTTRFDLVICGHLNLLPLASYAARRSGARLILVIYGIEAWARSDGFRRRLIARADSVVSISEFTRSRFLEWAPISPDRVQVIPCCVDESRFAPGPKREDLLARYDLRGRTVLMTLARLAGAERYKGFDEVMAVLPRLADTVPDVAYLIAGDGPDRARLEAKAEALGVRARVRFAGYVPDEEKADHYRLADLFVMPGRGEGFGIVYLEAMASGVPVVASTLDASRETVLGGRAGEVVDPDRPDEVRSGILRALDRNRASAGHAEALAHFSKSSFHIRWVNELNTITGRPSVGPR